MFLKKAKLLTAVLALVATIVGCGVSKFTPLQDNPTLIVVTKYTPGSTAVTAKIITDPRIISNVVEEINQGTHPVVHGSISCPNATSDNVYDIVVHYATQIRTFVFTVSGCTLLQDEKDNIIIYHNIPSITQQFK